jgi:hypothetical protein
VCPELQHSACRSRLFASKLRHVFSTSSRVASTSRLSLVVEYRLHWDPGPAAEPPPWRPSTLCVACLLLLPRILSGQYLCYLLRASVVLTGQQLVPACRTLFLADSSLLFKLFLTGRQFSWPVPPAGAYRI